MDNRTCDQCDVEFTPTHGRNRYCETHSGRRAAKLREYRDTTCVVCGAVWRSARRSTKLCSDECRAAHYRSRGIKPPGRAAAGTSGWCPLPATHPVRWIGSMTRIVFAHCNECGQLTCSPEWNVKTYCSKRCRNRVADRRRSQRRVRRHVKRKSDIFVRDGWTCWLCGGPTSKQYDRHDQLSPTVDHLTPRSRGGSDSADNLATAHMICNSRRRDTDLVTHPPPHIAA